jgi:alpha-L-fucosidase
MILKQAKIFEVPVTESCHAATIVEVKPDILMSAWFGGSYEGCNDVGIYTSFYRAGKWSEPELVAGPYLRGNTRLSCWNPVLFKSQSNCLYLFYKVGKNPREWFGAMLTSSDDGKTWSEPRLLPEGFLGPIKNKPIEVLPGEILCGSSTESSEDNLWRVHVELYNERNGEWTRIQVPNEDEFDVIQPAFLMHPDSIQMLCRSRHNKLITGWSYDYGRTWTNLGMLHLINSNSGIDAVAIEDRFLLVNNPLNQGSEWFHGRNVLDLEFSRDGIHWEKLLSLENEQEGEYSYPAIIQTNDGMIHIVYTDNRKYIKHVEIKL